MLSGIAVGGGAEGGVIQGAYQGGRTSKDGARCLPRHGTSK